MNKKVIAIISLVGVLAVGGGGFGIYKAIQSGGEPVEVVPVSDFSQMAGMFGDSSALSVNIVTDLSQEVHLDTDKVVKEVYVKEGDKVKVGDKLLAYDTTLMELDLEMYQLDGQTMELKLKGAETDLTKLKNTTPIADSGGTTTPKSNSTDNPGLDGPDSSDDEARAGVIQNVVFATTSQAGGPAEQNEGQDVSGNSADTGTNPSENTDSSENVGTPETTQTETQPTTETNPPEETETDAPVTASSVNIQVQWDHGTNAVKSQPTSVKAALMNGETKVNEQILSAESGWKIVFENLDPTITYTVKGESIESYGLTTKVSESGVVSLIYKYKEPSDSPDAVIKPYDVLDYKSEPYKGKGTKDSPYVFFCKDGTKIKGSFINKMLGFDEKGETALRKKGYYAKLEIREADSLTGGFIKSIGFDGTIKVEHGYAPGTTWIFSSDGIKKEEESITDPLEPDVGNDGDMGDIDWEDNGSFEEGYTADELKAAILEKEKDIRDLTLDKKENDIKVAKEARDLAASTVTSTLNGIVKSVGDPSVGEIDGNAFIVITSNEGMYVKGSISELKLGSIKKDDILQGQGNESGVSFSCKITEISEYPDAENYFGSFGNSNSNSSYYPFTAYIEEASGLGNNESAQLFLSAETANANAIYLEKAYVRTENGQSYVYKVDKDNKLKQQFVKTGKVLYQQFVEIKEGLATEDKIAFPYGKNVKNGAKVKDADNTDDTLM